MLIDFNIVVADSADANGECDRLTQESSVHEVQTFALPRSIWTMMFCAYGVFFAGLATATAHSLDAIFVVVVSVSFAVMYFGVAIVMNRVNAYARIGAKRSQSHDNIQTLTGSLSYAEACAQILTVPFLFAGFAWVVVVIRAMTSR